MKIFLGILFFVIANIIIWLQVNSQFIWDWWRDKPLTATLIYSIPFGLVFWYAVKYTVEATGELWSARLIGFGASYLVFPLMTFYIANESMFTTKTMICVALSLLIMAIQLFWDKVF
jgi:hypothetical protein